MNLEVEVKFGNADLNRVRRVLRDIGARFCDRVFERNIVFDDADGTMKEKDILLRLRMDGRNLMTIKTSPEREISDKVKAYNELETEIGDFETMQQMLSVLGFTPAFAYEKLRETWDTDSCHVCLDLLPFGDFVEIEGAQEDIYALAEQLELLVENASTANYHRLNLEYRERNGLARNPEFVFEEQARSKLILFAKGADKSSPLPSARDFLLKE